jgi:exopolyphosphatase/pppGpp-phosphohydrolase
MVLAGVDIGTLTCRLLIADISADGRLIGSHESLRLARKRMPGLEAGHEEVIVAGAIIIRTVMNTLARTNALSATSACARVCLSAAACSLTVCSPIKND